MKIPRGLPFLIHASSASLAAAITARPGTKSLPEPLSAFLRALNEDYN